MPEYNFKPDYAKWWKKKNIGHDDLCWLLQGVDPDHVTKARKLENKEKSAEENSWLWQFNRQLPPFLSNDFSNYKKLLSPYKDKQKLINHAYDSYLKIPPDFLDFLVSIKVIKKDEKLEKYKNHSLYTLDYNTLSPQDITSENEALSVLLGLQFEYFAQFIALNERQTNEPKDSDGFAAYARFSSEERWFYSEYRQFLEKQYYDITAVPLINHVVNAAKALNLWKGNFNDYVQKLYNEGVIFKEDVYEQLLPHGITVDIAHDSWALKFYKYWISQGGWTLKEAVSLFKGSDPRKNHRSLIDVSQNTWILNYDSHCLSWDEFENTVVQLDERLARHTAIQEISHYEMGKDVLYKPAEIVAWLQKHTVYLPPKALLMALGNDVLSQYEATEQNRINQNENIAALVAPSQSLKEVESEMYRDAVKIWGKFIETHGKEPTREQTAIALAANVKYSGWKPGSIVRYLSAERLNKNYCEYKNKKALKELSA